MIVLNFSGLAAGLTLAAGLMCQQAFAQTHLVAPPGGVDDTAAVQAGLDLCKDATAACRVQLAEGVYVIRQVVVQNFRGHLAGMGRAKTTLRAKPSLDVTPTFYMDVPTAANVWPSLVSFVDGDVTVSDLRMEALEDAPTNGFLIYNSLAVLLMFMGDVEHSVVERVDFEGRIVGDPGNFPGYNVFNGTYHENLPFIPPMQGEHRISDCSYKNLASGTSVTGMEGAKMTVGGNPNQANRYEHVGYGVELIDIGTSSIEIVNNHIQSHIYGVYMLQEFADAWYLAAGPAQFLIHHNDIRIYEGVGGAEGITATDLAYANGLPRIVEPLISNNSIALGEPVSGGIDLWHIENGVVANNRVGGVGTWGIAAIHSTGCVLQANNTQKFVPAATGASVYLEDSMNCTVVGGGNNKENVVVVGGAGNVITGVTPMSGSAIGQALNAARAKLQAAKKAAQLPY